MKVLLLGATGNVGIRMVPALLTHGHKVNAFVRSSSKLESLLPASTFQQINVVQGDATDSKAIRKAILDNGCEAVVNTAGVAGMAPWAQGSGGLPAIVRAVLDAAQEAGSERRKPLRLWLFGGQSVLYYPGTETMLSSYVPIFLEHRKTLASLKSLPPNSVDWSMICPSNMTPESTDFSVPTKSSQGRLIANATTPPNWQDSWLRHIPLIGRFIVVAMNSSRYFTTLEQTTDFIATDLETTESKYSLKAVGTIDPSK